MHKSIYVYMYLGMHVETCMIMYLCVLAYMYVYAWIFVGRYA